MSTTAVPAADSFELTVTITGLCLLLTDGDHEEVTLLMPNARKGSERENAMRSMKHRDTTEATAHVPYLSVPLVHVTGGTAESSSATIVRLINHEQIAFSAPTSGKVDIKATLPSFETFAPALRVQASTMEANPGDGVIGRCTFWGGRITGVNDKIVRQMTRVLGSDASAGIQQEGEFAHPAIWTSTVEGQTLKVTLTSFASGAVETFELQPVVVDGKRRIDLTLANLCSWNPLEWDGFELPPREAADLDFKWFDSLMESRPGTLTPVFDLANPVPHPVAKTMPREEGAIYNCVPGRAGYPPK